VRVPDAAILAAKMTMVTDPMTIAGKIAGTGSVVAIANTGQTSLLALVYRLKDAKVSVAETGFEVAGKKFAAGSLLVGDVSDAALAPVMKDLSLDGVRLATAPTVATHVAKSPRIAIMHTWLSTEAEGWWRYAFDHAGVPYTIISTQTAGAETDLRGKYDVIVFGPMGFASSDLILNGTPMFGNATPWQKTELTPNLGLIDSTADTRPGLGYAGLEHLRGFVEKGGLLIACEDTAQFAIEMGLAPGVSLARGEAKVVGSVLNSAFVATDYPAAWGYGATLPVMSANGMSFSISSMVGRGGGHRVLTDPYSQRVTGRGNVDDSDVVQGRKDSAPEALKKEKPWEASPLNEEQMRDNPAVIPVALRPEVVLRFGDSNGLLISGLLDSGGSIAEHAIVVDAHLGEGNVLLFANNPIYRGETIGSYPMVFNAILNFEHLRPVAKAAAK